MLLDSGICTIYELREAPASGAGQGYRLSERSKRCYKELTVGYGRHYEARRSSESVDMCLRIWRDSAITLNDICVVGGRRYRIRQIQHREDKDGLLVTDLALELAHSWEINEAEVEASEGETQGTE